MDKRIDLINKIVEKKKNYNRKTQLGLSEHKFSHIVRDTADTLNYELPYIYLKLLEITDGIDHNGIVLYASETAEINGRPDRQIEGITEANKLWREGDNQNIFVFAESGDYLYVHNLENNQFQVVDRITQDEICTFDTFEKLLVTVLKNMLDVYDY